MRRIVVLVVMLALVLLAPASAAGAGDNFVATLSGDQEVPARDTQAVGVATFKLREDGTALQFKVNVANIDNVVATDLAAVLAAMASGATYVNVHTNDGVAPPNTGPGDFPGGEIRGQVR